MAEDKRANPFPFPTAEEVEAAPGSPAQKAARNIVSRYIDGIPKRGFVLGGSDSAPIVKGITDLTTLCYELLEEIIAVESEPTPEVQSAATRLLNMMEDHRCPPSSQT